MGLLDENSYPFSDPDGKELLDTLADLYAADQAESLARRAGVPVTRVDFRRAPADAWQNLLPVAARSGTLRVLARVIMTDPESVAVRPLLQRLIDDMPQPLPAGLDQYSLGLLPPRRAFINRAVLRDHLRELSDPDGARVLLVTGASGLGKSHSWHLISYIGDRVGRYAAHRVDLADWTGPKLSARQLMAEMFADLGWKPAEVDSAAQPDTVVRLLISAFKNRVRSLPRPVCLVFDGFTSRTSDEFARRFVVSMADAVNEDQSLDARVVLLEVEAPLPADLAADALPETLRAGQQDDLPPFFEAAAAAVGERLGDGALRVLMDAVLGPAPYPAEFPLSDVGPKAARVAAAAFRPVGRRPGAAAARTVSAAEIEGRLAGIAAALTPAPDPVSEPRQRLRAAAVIRGFFTAGDLAAQTGDEITDGDLQVFIQRDCEAVNSVRGRGWQLVPAVRRETVRHLGANPRRLLKTTRGVPPDPADLGRAMAELYLRGEAPAVPDQSPDQLTGSLLAVDWLSGSGLGLPAADTLHSRQQLAVLLEPLRTVLDGFFTGREEPLRRLAEYAARPVADPSRPLVISGAGGMGKSTVIARFLIDWVEAAEPSRRPFTYLTFDRPELLPQRPFGLLAEMTRQLSLQHPGIAAVAADTVAALERTQRGVAISEVDRSRARSQRTSVAERRRRDERRLVELFAEVVSLTGAKSVVCVLDTFERAQRQGQAAVGRLLDVLEAVRDVLPGLRIVIAGRGGLIGYPVEEVPLTRLAPDEVRGYLSARAGQTAEDISSSLLEAVARRMNGNPLSLRLAADLMLREAGTLRTAAGRRRFLLALEGDQIQGLLYRRVLDHIDDEDVRALAVPGLALRRITPEIIEKVLAPACRRGPVSRDRARELFDRMRQETSLVTMDGDALVHRADVRQDILPLLTSEDSDGVTAIHRHAVRYYSEWDTVADRTEELYHRLALGQPARTLDRHWNNEAGARLDAALDELPPASQVYLASRLDIEADPRALRAVDDEAWARQAIRSAQTYLNDGHPQEALKVLRQRRLGAIVFDHAALEVETLAKLGRRPAAQKLAAQAADAASEAGNEPEFVRFSLLGAQLAEDAGSFAKALTMLSAAREVAQNSRDVVNALVAGVGVLRVWRRSGRQVSKRTRELRADVRAQALTLTRRQRTANPSLVRDLAAELGAELPSFVVEASKRVGIDVRSEQARDQLAREGKGASAARAAEILESSRPEPDLDHDSEYITSDEQGVALGEHLEHSAEPGDYAAVADLFQSEADQRSF
jgi:hypothetical protein